MRRKNLAATVATLLCALMFIIIGSCFSSFLYKDQIIEVESPRLVLPEGIQAFSASGDKTIDKLELSNMKLGLKPATGEEDPESGIPSTVSEKNGSEGYYSKFKLYAPAGAKISVKNIKIENKINPEEAEKERENIFVSIKQLSSSTKSLSGETVELASLVPSDERKEFTLFIWLDAKAGEGLKGSKISFEIWLSELT